MLSASNGSAATTLKSAQSAYELHQAFSHELREECLYTGAVHGLGVSPITMGSSVLRVTE